MNRKNLLSLIIVTALSLSLVGPLQAQQTLSIEDALRIAVENSPQLQASLLEVKRADLGVIQADGDFISNFSADLGYTNNTTPQAGINGALLGSNNNGTSTISQESINSSMTLSRLFGPGTRLSATLNVDRSLTLPEGVDNLDPNYGVGLRLELTQPWLQGFGRTVNEANIDRFKVQRTGAQASALRTANTLLLDTITAYWELWYNQKNLTLNQQALKLAQQQLELGRARVDAGSIPENDLLPLLTQEASIMEDLENARANVRTSSITLAQLLGRPETSSNYLQTKPEAPALPGQNLDPNFFELVKANAPSLAELDAELQSADLDLALAEDQNKPQLNSSAWISSNGLGSEFSNTAEQFGTLEATGFFVGLTFSAPVSRRATRASLDLAGLAKRSVDLRIQTELQRLKAEVDTRQTSLEASYRRLDLTKRTVELAQRSTQAQVDSFKAGDSTPIDVAQVLQSQREAEQRFTRLQVDITLAHMALYNLTGELPRQMGITLDDE